MSALAPKNRRLTRGSKRSAGDEAALQGLLNVLELETRFGPSVLAAIQHLHLTLDALATRLVIVSGPRRVEERLGDRALLQAVEDGLGGGVSRKLARGSSFSAEAYTLATSEGERTVWVHAWPIGQGQAWVVLDSPLADKEAKANSMIQLLVYLSPLWEARERLAEVDAAERQLRERQVSFATNVSHELRTPLTNMVGYLKALRKEVDESTGGLLNVAQEEAGKLQRLVEGFQDFLRTERREQQIHTERFDAAQALKGLLEVHRQFATAERPMSKAMPETLEVNFDLEVLQAITSELLENARKYGEGLIEVTLSPEPHLQMARLSVKDNGKGVEDAELPHLFDRFFKARKPEAYNAGGAGLGLFVAKERALAAGGDLVAENTGGGLRMSLLMPLA